MAIYLMTCTIRVNLMVFLSYSFLIWAPLYQNLYTDEHEMLFPIILPFIDPETDNGFTINIINQMISVMLGTFVIPGLFLDHLITSILTCLFCIPYNHSTHYFHNTGTEIVTCVLKNNVTATAAVIENSLLEFKCMVRKERKFSIKCTWEFRNIILKILDFDRFHRENFISKSSSV